MKTAAPTDFRLVNPEMFTTFVEVSFHKLPTNISNDMMKKLRNCGITINVHVL